MRETAEGEGRVTLLCGRGTLNPHKTQHNSPCNNTKGRAWRLQANVAELPEEKEASLSSKFFTEEEEVVVEEEPNSWFFS